MVVGVMMHVNAFAGEIDHAGIGYMVHDDQSVQKGSEVDQGAHSHLYPESL